MNLFGKREPRRKMPSEPQGTICEMIFGTDEHDQDRMFGRNRHGVWYQLKPSGWEPLPEIPDDEPIGRLAE